MNRRQMECNTEENRPIFGNPTRANNALPCARTLMRTVSRTAAFFDCVCRSGLAAADSLHVAMGAQTPEIAARLLVGAGLLTRFQGDVLLKGKHKGFVVGKYQILDLLGVGGMGRVYLCEHTGMGHRVAMKVLPPDAEQSPATVERFLREARAAARLNHPNIVRTYDLDRANGHHFIIMQYMWTG